MKSMYLSFRDLQDAFVIIFFFTQMILSADRSKASILSILPDSRTALKKGKNGRKVYFCEFPIKVGNTKDTLKAKMFPRSLASSALKPMFIVILLINKKVSDMKSMYFFRDRQHATIVSPKNLTFRKVETENFVFSLNLKLCSTLFRH